MSNLSAFPYIAERSEGTPGLWNLPLSIISANIAALDSGLTSSSPSGNTFSFLTNIETSGGAHFQHLSIGSTPPSYATTAALTIEVNSAHSDYIYLVDSSAQKSSYVIGSRAGNLADGLNIWDASAGTMIASFSKQSVRFFQNVVGPVFDVGGALASTLNAGTFGTGANSNETRIQAAILAAATAGLARVYVPANMYPYSASSLSFIHTVQMVREGGDWTVYDVVAYGAYADFSRSDATAINAALSAASAHGGGVVYLPNGTYKISQPIDMGDTTTNTIYLKGQGRRDCTIRPDASVHTAVIVGRAGQSTSYGNIVDLTITAIDTSNHTGCGLHMISPQFWTLDNINIEHFDQGTGLYLEGSASASAPHAYRNQFRQLVCVTSQRPAYLKNADENTFLQAQFGLPTGISGSSMTCVEITQGRNNIFLSTTMQGETSSLTTGRPSYIGLYCSTPALGDNAFHQFYGMVCEGFERGVVIQSTQVRGIQFYNYNSSINSLAIADGGLDTIDMSVPQQRAFFGGVYPFSPAVDISDGTTVPNLQKGNVFNTNNTSLTTITSFANTASGRLFWLHTGPTDKFTVILDAANGGTDIRLWGRSNLTLAPQTTLPFMNLGGIFYQAGPPITTSVPLGSVTTALFESPLPFAAKVPGTAITPQFTFGSEASLGFYRSNTSNIAMSYGQLLVSGDPYSISYPTLAFTSARSTGFIDNTGPGLDVVVAGTVSGRALANQWLFGQGSALLPGLGNRSEISLGLYRSGVSTIGLSYGAIAYPDGSSTTPSISFSSNSSLGLYSSGLQTIAQSYGTFDLTATITSLGTIRVKSGANNSCGTAVLGSNGSVNVANTYVKTGDLIFLTDQTAGGTLGDLELGGIRNSSGFTILSTSVTDTSTVAWLIVRPG